MYILSKIKLRYVHVNTLVGKELKTPVGKVGNTNVKNLGRFDSDQIVFVDIHFQNDGREGRKHIHVVKNLNSEKSWEVWEVR